MTIKEVEIRGYRVESKKHNKPMKEKTELLELLLIAERAHAAARQSENFDVAQSWAMQMSNIERRLSLLKDQQEKETEGVIR